MEALEVAAHDGRLEKVDGVGARRAAAIRTGVADLLARRIKDRHRVGKREPTVSELLSVDAEYRERVMADNLPKIAPKRFNPDRAAWLPVLHTLRDEWQFTVMFSNTAQAHKFLRTRDWVVIYFYDELQREGQRTVVTEQEGGLRGKRVVRGREAECRAHYTTI